jgi:hypothetical protein
MYTFYRLNHLCSSYYVSSSRNPQDLKTNFYTLFTASGLLLGNHVRHHRSLASFRSHSVNSNLWIWIDTSESTASRGPPVRFQRPENDY